MSAAIITIGRNVTEFDDVQAPMPDEQWAEFREALASTAAKFMAEVWTAADYDGGWDGAPEDAHVIYGPLANDDVQALENDLKALKERFYQEAIGLMVGEPRLI